jgi:hypothetical protein|tara:strand:+ start:1767 stop:2552 length:786 start_codon:yes stop_codon:yes gene_type:complete
MNKLFELKKWITVDQAASYLSEIFDENVSPSDVYQLGIDELLVLSVRFMGEYKAKKGDIVAYEDRSSQHDGDAYSIPLDTRLAAEASPYLNVREHCCWLRDVWDLHIHAGSALHVIINALRSEEDEPYYDAFNPDGIIVSRGGMEFAELQDGKKGFEEPSKRLTFDSVIVVRTEAIKEFVQNTKKTKSTDSHVLNPRTEASYQRLVAALLSVIDGSQNSAKHPNYVNDSQLIAHLSSLYDGYDGLSQRTLETRLSKCRSIL